MALIAGWTAITRQAGASALIAIATPETQAAAARRHEHRAGIRDLLGDLEADRPCARDHERVVERVQHGAPVSRASAAIRASASAPSRDSRSTVAP